MVHYDTLIDALAEKDEEAFTIVYEQTRHAVYAIIIAIVKNRANCEDIMQETYMAMLEKIHQYQKGKNFLNWLLAIAKNKAIDYYRRQHNELLVDVDEAENLFPETKAVGERSKLVEDIINRLSDAERQVFLLHIIEDIRFRDIAKITKLPLGTVLWHFRNAMQKIKQMNGGE